LARAKNTDRAEARRRTREAQRAAEPQDDDVITSDATAVAVEPGPSMGTAMRSSMRMPNIREDLRIVPGMILRTRKLWIPFIALFAAFIVAMLLPKSSALYVTQGVIVVVGSPGIIPEGLDRIAALFVQLTLPPTALFVFFIGGFLAPRASYLVGAILGLIDGVLWSIYVFTAPTASTDGFQTDSFTDVFAIIFIAVMIGTLAAGFAAWYRNFLRSSQERARANRAAREQQMRAKAKEDERKAKEDQRKAAIEAREAAKAAKSAGSASKGTPPAS